MKTRIFLTILAIFDTIGIVYNNVNGDAFLSFICLIAACSCVTSLYKIFNYPKLKVLLISENNKMNKHERKDLKKLLKLNNIPSGVIIDMKHITPTEYVSDNETRDKLMKWAVLCFVSNAPENETVTDMINSYNVTKETKEGV